MKAMIIQYSAMPGIPVGSMVVSKADAPNATVLCARMFTFSDATIAARVKEFKRMNTADNRNLTFR